MTVHRPLVALLTIALLAITLAACGGDDDSDADNVASAPTAASPAGEFPVSVDRSDDKELVVDAPVRRIVSLSPGATEIIYAIGAEDALAAVDNNANYPQGVATLSGRVDAYQPNIEAIAGFEPDLVIVANNIDGIVEALDRLSIPVLFLDIDSDVTSIDDVFEHIDIMGRITGRTDASEALLDGLRGRVDAVEEKMGIDPPTTVIRAAPSFYHELDAELYSIADDTFIGSLYAILGARNIAGDGGGIAYPQLTQEAIIAANPDVIVLADEAFGVTIDSVRARPGWDAIAAVQNDRIYAINPDIISRPGPRIVDALEQLARDLYPEVFE
ncbi:MAG: helical backbone metal receptor [Dehalococcoidia bacterium]